VSKQSVNLVVYKTKKSVECSLSIETIEWLNESRPVVRNRSKPLHCNESTKSIALQTDEAVCECSSQHIEWSNGIHHSIAVFTFTLFIQSTIALDPNSTQGQVLVSVQTSKIHFSFGKNNQLDTDTNIIG